MGCAMTGAVAADDLGGFYLGANFGRARNAYDTKFIDSQYQGVATAAGDSLEQSARSLQKMSDTWWADAGYFFTPYTAFDLAFLHAGEVRYQTAGTLSVQGVSRATNLFSEPCRSPNTSSSMCAWEITSESPNCVKLSPWLGTPLLSGRRAPDPACSVQWDWPIPSPVIGHCVRIFFASIRRATARLPDDTASIWPVRAWGSFSEPSIAPMKREIARVKHVRSDQFHA
jgi:hypothetical protein